MKITGNVSSIELDNVVFSQLKGVENKCSESLEYFEEGDKVVAISLGEYRDSSIALNEGIYFVKKRVAGDFLSRFLDTLNVEIVKSTENN